MRDALIWVRDALSSKPFTVQYGHYLIKDKMIHATDGRMTAAHPFPCHEEFCANGAALEKLLARLSGNITVTVSPDDVTLKSGRLGGTIKTIPVGDWQYPLVDDMRLPIPERMIAGLRQLRPFISDNASKSWALCVHAINDTLFATNNISAAAIPEIDLDGVNALIPYWAVDFVLAREGVTHWSHGPGYIAFHWSNGAWMRTQLVDDQFPDTIEGLINKAGFANERITPEWRVAFEDASALAEDYVIMHADRMTGKTKGDTMAVEVQATTLVPAGPPSYSAWTTKFMIPVMGCATHWQPDKYPDAVPFRGDGIVGVIVGRRA